MLLLASKQRNNYPFTVNGIMVLEKVEREFNSKFCILFKKFQGRSLEEIITILATDHSNVQLLCSLHLSHNTATRRSGSVVSASELQPKDPVFDPLADHGEGQFFCPSKPTLVQTCLCLTPLRVYGTHPNLCVR